MARKTTVKTTRAAPIANENAGILRRQLAPWPQVDRWPTALGSRISIQYIWSCFLTCQNGWRQQYVDVLDELLERDSHAQSVLSQRALAVAGGRIELTAAPVADATSDEARQALAIRDDLQRRFDAIPARTQAIYALVFSELYYGAGGLELMWAPPSSTGWNIDALNFIHSRRISYPDQDDWSPHIWDQGAVGPGKWGSYPTQGFFGLRVLDYPGKFLIHTAQFRADYPTRDGLGRVIVWMMAIKLMAMRGAGDFVERFSKPWAWGQYTTEEQTMGKPRAANDLDIQSLTEALAALGAGSLAGAALPDTVKIMLDGPAIKGATGAINHAELIALCDAQTSKAVRGGTLQADAGEKGARSLGEVHAEGDVRNARYDAQCLADRLKAEVVWWLCHLNYPGYEHLCPGVTIHVEQITPDQILDRATKFAAMGGKPDARWLAQILGITRADPTDPDSAPLAPLKPTDLFALAASAQDLPSAVEAMAALVGVSITPGMKSTIAEMDRDDVARLLQQLLGASKQAEKNVAEEGAAEEGGAGAAAPDVEPRAAKPTRTPAKKTTAPVGGKTQKTAPVKASPTKE